MNRATKVLKSLPGGVWDTYGASGWGPDGKHEFLAFDYRDELATKSFRTTGEPDLDRDMLPKKASAFFVGNSCAWTKFFVDKELLDAVGKLYAPDYLMYGWYRLKPWKKRMRACLEERDDNMRL